MSSALELSSRWDVSESGSERHRAGEWITARGDVKGTFCAFLQHKHLSPSSPRSLPSQLFLRRLQPFQPPSLLKMIRKYRRSASGQSGMELVEGGRIGRLQPCKAPAITLATGPVQGCYFTSRWPEEKKSGFQRDSCCRQTPGGPLQSASRLVSQHLYKGSGSPVLFCFHSCSSPVLSLGFFVFCFCFSLLLFSWVPAFGPNPMCDLSQHTGSQEFTEIIHISTYDVYIKKKNGFSPPWVKMFVQPITRLGVPELVSHGVSTLLLLLFGFFFLPPFLPLSMRLSLCWCFCFNTAQQNLQRRPYTSAKMFYMPWQICTKKIKKKTQCLYHNGKLGAALYTFEECGGKKPEQANWCWIICTCYCQFCLVLLLGCNFILFFFKKPPVGVLFLLFCFVLVFFFLSDCSWTPFEYLFVAFPSHGTLLLDSIHQRRHRCCWIFFLTGRVFMNFFSWNWSRKGFFFSVLKKCKSLNY